MLRPIRPRPRLLVLSVVSTKTYRPHDGGGDADALPAVEAHWFLEHPLCPAFQRVTRRRARPISPAKKKLRRRRRSGGPSSRCRAAAGLACFAHFRHHCRSRELAQVAARSGSPSNSALQKGPPWYQSPTGSAGNAFCAARSQRRLETGLRDFAGGKSMIGHDCTAGPADRRAWHP